jgi:hypothetical protein
VKQFLHILLWNLYFGSEFIVYGKLFFEAFMSCKQISSC